MQSDEMEAGITASGKRRRDRRKRLKRLGFEQVSIYVPKSEVKALKREMALKVKAAEARKALAEYERAGRDAVEGAQDHENKAGSDVLAGATPPATAAPMNRSPNTPAPTATQTPSSPISGLSPLTMHDTTHGLTGGAQGGYPPVRTDQR